MPMLSLISHPPVGGVFPDFALVDILGISELQFSPFKLIFLIAWVYLCLYCVQRVQLNPILGNSQKLLANLATLFAGPMVLLILAVLDI